MDLVPAGVRDVMRRLEAQDARDRVDGTPREKRLRAIEPTVGPFLLTLVLAIGARRIVEIGTSGGYSTLWLATGAARNGGSVTTYDIDPAKAEISSRAFADAGLEHCIDARLQDGLEGLKRLHEETDLVFIDSEKEQYEGLLGPAVEALRTGGVLVADNLLSHEEDLAGFREAALGHPRLSGLVVPFARGELVAVKIA